MRNVYDSEVTDAEREAYFAKLPKERRRNSAEIVKSGLGTPYEMSVVFAALASQAGLEVRPVYVADWQEVAFNPKTMPSLYFLDHLDMAVKIGDAWKFYDLGAKLLTPGMLPWSQEGAAALLTDPQKPLFVVTPFSPPGASLESKTAHLELSKDGSLVGDVDESYTGHRAFEYRSELRGRSDDQCREWLRDRVTRMFPEAEVTALQIRNAADPLQPMLIHYHVVAPQYAQVAGKRIFFHILPLERGNASPFTAAERKNPVRFPFAWKETDDVTIRLPDGFALDNAESPGSIRFGKTGGYTLSISMVGKRDLVTKRELIFGDAGQLDFAVPVYAAVRKTFDEIQKRDSATLALKESQ